MLRPKRFFSVNLPFMKQMKGSKIGLPDNVNEMYQDCVEVTGEIAVRSYYNRQGGSGNNLYVLDSAGAVVHGCTLRCRTREDNTVNIHPRYTSMGYLQDGVFLLASTDEYSKLDGCVHYLPKKEMSGVVENVHKLEIGDKCVDVATVKDKQIGHVLGSKKGNSILVEVKWNKEQLEVVKEHIISDQMFDRVYLEM